MSSLSRRRFTTSASASSRQRRPSTRSGWGGSGGDFGKRMTLARLAMSIGSPVGGPLATPAALDWLRGGRDNASLPMAQATDGSYIGRPLKRVEDRRLVQGRGRYVDDFNPPGCLSAAFVRSPYAHARLTALRVEAARSAPGVVAVFTGADVAHLGPMPVNRIFPAMKEIGRASCRERG